MKHEMCPSEFQQGRAAKLQQNCNRIQLQRNFKTAATLVTKWNKIATKVQQTCSNNAAQQKRNKTVTKCDRVGGGESLWRIIGCVRDAKIRRKGEILLEKLRHTRDM